MHFRTPMALSEKESKQIIDFVKKEPRTIQEISLNIGRSWVTTEAYVHQVSQTTGLISVKGFRKGSRSSIKLVYYNSSESMQGDSLKSELYDMIKAGRNKNDFDFMEVFQFVDVKKKKHLILTDTEGNQGGNLAVLFRQAKESVLCFSGNLSFLNLRYGKVKIIDLVEDAVRRGVTVRIICRVNLASMNNIRKLEPILRKYQNSIEIRHRYQPLRGFIIDNQVARFANEEQLKLYKQGELEKDTLIFYEIYDPEWIAWLQKAFWQLWRPSIDYDLRFREIKRLQ